MKKINWLQLVFLVPWLLKISNFDRDQVVSRTSLGKVLKTNQLTRQNPKQKNPKQKQQTNQPHIHAEIKPTDQPNETRELSVCIVFYDSL